MKIINSPLLAALSHPSFIHSKRFVVLFGDRDEYRKLFSVQFERRENGLGYYVHLPYFAHNRGVLGEVTIPAGDGPMTIDYGPTATTTTERVKFTHHPDGRAQFSQDGKVLTQVITHTVPLHEYQGHLFTVNFWGVEGFQTAKAKDKKPPTTDSAAIMFQPHDPNLPPREQVGRIIASRYTVPYTGMEVAPHIATSGLIQRPVSFKRWDGTFDHGIPIFPPAMRLAEFHITLRYEPMVRRLDDRESALSLFGGFQAPLGNAGPMHGIIIAYTDRDEEEWEQLVRERGTVDLASNRAIARQLQDGLPILHPPSS